MTIKHMAMPVCNMSKEGKMKNMALVKCDGCGHEISENAECCPNCGHKTKRGIYETEKKRNDGKRLAYTVVLVLGIVFAIINIAQLYDLYEKWDSYTSGWYVDRGFDAFWKYLTYKEETSVFWAALLCVIISFVGGLGAHYAGAGAPRVPSPEQTSRERGPWVCASCGFENAERVGTCQSCGVTKEWSQSQKL